MVIEIIMKINIAGHCVRILLLQNVWPELFQNRLGYAYKYSTLSYIYMRQETSMARAQRMSGVALWAHNCIEILYHSLNTVVTPIIDEVR